MRLLSHLLLALWLPAVAQTPPARPTLPQSEFRVSQAWGVAQIAYQRRSLDDVVHGRAPQEVKLSPKAKHIFVAIEVSLANGNFISGTVIFGTKPDGSWIPAGMLYEGEKGEKLPTTKATLLDSSGTRYSLQMAVIGSTLFSQVEGREPFAEPLNPKDPFAELFEVKDPGATKGFKAPAKGKVLLIYEVAAGSRGFTLKIEENEVGRIVLGE